MITFPKGGFFNNILKYDEQINLKIHHIPNTHKKN